MTGAHWRWLHRSDVSNLKKRVSRVDRRWHRASALSSQIACLDAEPQSRREIRKTSKRDDATSAKTRRASKSGITPVRAWYCNAMRTTIDKAGRVVIPAAVRERAGLAPGSELEITEDELGIRLTRTAAGPRLVKVGRRLVARPTVAAADRPSVDIAALIEDERNRWP